MRVDIKVPNVGESITEVEIGEWFRRQGDSVSKNENLLLLETDKASVEIQAPESGTLVEVLKENGESASIGEVLGRLETDAGEDSRTPESADVTTRHEPNPPAPEEYAGSQGAPSSAVENSSTAPDVTPAPGQKAPASTDSLPEQASSETDTETTDAQPALAPEAQDADPSAAQETPIKKAGNGAGAASPRTEQAPSTADRRDERIAMSLLRRRIAERLTAAQQNAALLTTFNEIDMSAVIDLRKSHGDSFRERHGIKLGFMSFFVKAAVAALQSVREVNAEIDGDTVVYHHYCDIGVAIGGGKGLVVPVLRNSERMSFAAIERAIDDLSNRARGNQLKPHELHGGTFTITNGGVYGSLFSTPIINPPQSAILGLHAIQDRPVARDNQLMVRPMMYVALTYDHRLIDGREAVLFLKQVKSLIEEPARMLLEY